MNSNIVFGFIISISFSFFGGMWLIAGAWNVTQLNSILAECQKDLPRSQTCELVAVVKK